MSGALRKTMVYLGLAEDQGRHDYDYDGHYEEHYDDAPAAPVTSIDSHRPVASVVRQHAGLGVSRITTIHPRTYNEAKTIGENFREGVPVIMITSRTAEKHRNYALEIGANHYLGKPYDEDELLRRIAGYIKAKQLS